MVKMATQSKVKIRSGNSLTKLADKMAARNQEIRPVGAWAQPATYFCLDAAVRLRRIKSLFIAQSVLVVKLQIVSASDSNCSKENSDTKAIYYDSLKFASLLSTAPLVRVWRFLDAPTVTKLLWVSLG